MFRNQKVAVLTECAVMVALATVLSLVIVFEMPLGGSVTLLSMLPILLVSYRRGWKAGMACGLTYAVLQLLLGLRNVTFLPDWKAVVLCILLDYLLPFTLLGAAGMLRRVTMVRSERANRVLTFTLGVGAVILVRYFCHVLSGVVIWYSLDRVWYASDPQHLVFRYGAWAFSAIYNGSFMLPELVLSEIGAAVVASVRQIASVHRQ